MRLPSQYRTQRNKYIAIIFILLLILMLTSISLSGCTYKTYTGNIGDATFSFQYRKNDRVNPYNPYSGSYNPPPPIPEGGFFPDSHININIYEKDAITDNAEMSLELFLSSSSENGYLRDFEVRARGTVIIAGITAKYANYFYTGYTTVPVPYEGQFASFIHGDYIVNIDVLFEEGNLDTDKAFDLIVDTFTINK